MQSLMGAEMEAAEGDEEDEMLKRRRSERARQEPKRPYSPDFSLPSSRPPSHSQKKRRSKGVGTPSTIAERPFDRLPNGKPFSCDLCQSPYVSNSQLSKRGSRGRRSKHMPSPRQKKDPISGRVLLLCNACVTLERPKRQKRAKALPSAEEKERYLAGARHFAQTLAEELQDTDAERLYCPAFSLSPCGCLQKYITSAGVGGCEGETRLRKVESLLELLRQARELSQQKCYPINTVTSKRGKNRNIGLGNGHKRSMEFEKFVLEQRLKLRQERKLCERAIQRILHYSNNFLHKKLKTDETGRRRARRVKGKAALGTLIPLTELTRHRCCVDKCVRMVLTHHSLVHLWRKRAVSGQQEARRVLAEMLTPAGGLRANCYKFVSMVTGCSFSTISKVNEQMRCTGGQREPPKHGLVSFLQHHPRRRAIHGGKAEVAAGEDVGSQALDAMSASELPEPVNGEAECRNAASDSNKPRMEPEQQQQQPGTVILPASVSIQQLLQSGSLQHASDLHQLLSQIQNTSCLPVGPPAPTVAADPPVPAPPSSLGPGAANSLQSESAAASKMSGTIRLVPVQPLQENSSLKSMHGARSTGGTFQEAQFADALSQGSLLSLQGAPVNSSAPPQGATFGNFVNLPRLEVSAALNSQETVSGASCGVQEVRLSCGTQHDLFGLQRLGVQFDGAQSLGIAEAGGSTPGSGAPCETLVSVPDVSNSKEQVFTIVQSDSLLKGQTVYVVSGMPSAERPAGTTQQAQFLPLGTSSSAVETPESRMESSFGQQVTALIQQTVGLPASVCLVQASPSSQHQPALPESQRAVGVSADGVVSKTLQHFPGALPQLTSASSVMTFVPSQVSQVTSASSGLPVNPLGVCDAGSAQATPVPRGFGLGQANVKSLGVAEAAAAVAQPIPADGAEKTSVQMLSAEVMAPSQLGGSVRQVLPQVPGPAVVQLVTGSVPPGGPNVTQLGLAPGQPLTSLLLISASPLQPQAATPQPLGIQNVFHVNQLGQVPFGNVREGANSTSILLPSDQTLLPGQLLGQGQLVGQGEVLVQGQQGLGASVVVTQAFPPTVSQAGGFPQELLAVQGGPGNHVQSFPVNQSQVLCADPSSVQTPAAAQVGCQQTEGQTEVLNSGQAICRNQGTYQLIPNLAQGQVMYLNQPSTQNQPAVDADQSSTPSSRSEDVQMLNDGFHGNEQVQKLVNFACSLQPLSIPFAVGDGDGEDQGTVVQVIRQLSPVDEDSVRVPSSKQGLPEPPSSSRTAGRGAASQGLQAQNLLQGPALLTSADLQQPTGRAAKQASRTRKSRQGAQQAEGQPLEKKKSQRKPRAETSIVSRAGKRNSKKSQKDTDTSAAELSSSLQLKDRNDASQTVFAGLEQTFAGSVVLNLPTSSLLNPQGAAGLVQAAPQDLERLLMSVSCSGGASSVSETAVFASGDPHEPQPNLNVMISGNSSQSVRPESFTASQWRPVPVTHPTATVATASGPCVMESASLSQLPACSVSGSTANVQTVVVKARGVNTDAKTHTAALQPLTCSETSVAFVHRGLVSQPKSSVSLQNATLQSAAVPTDAISGSGWRTSHKGLHAKDGRTSQSVGSAGELAGRSSSTIRFAHAYNAGEHSKTLTEQVSTEGEMQDPSSPSPRGSESLERKEQSVQPATQSVSSLRGQGWTAVSSPVAAAPRISFQVGASAGLSSRGKRTRVSSQSLPHRLTKSSSLDLPASRLESSTPDAAHVLRPTLGEGRAGNGSSGVSSFSPRIQFSISSASPGTGRPSSGSGLVELRKKNLPPAFVPMVTSSGQLNRPPMSESLESSSSSSRPASVAPVGATSRLLGSPRPYSAVTHMPLEQLLSAHFGSSQPSGGEEAVSQPASHPDVCFLQGGFSQVDHSPDPSQGLHPMTTVEECSSVPLGSICLDGSQGEGITTLLLDRDSGRSHAEEDETMPVAESGQNVVIHHPSQYKLLTGSIDELRNIICQNSSSGKREQVFESSRGGERTGEAQTHQKATIHHHSKPARHRGKGNRRQDSYPLETPPPQRAPVRSQDSRAQSTVLAGCRSGISFQLSERVVPPNTVAPVPSAETSLASGLFHRSLPSVSAPSYAHLSVVDFGQSTNQVSGILDAMENTGPPNTVAPSSMAKRASRRSRKRQLVQNSGTAAHSLIKPGTQTSVQNVDAADSPSYAPRASERHTQLRPSKVSEGQRPSVGTSAGANLGMQEAVPSAASTLTASTESVFCAPSSNFSVIHQGLPRQGAKRQRLRGDVSPTLSPSDAQPPRPTVAPQQVSDSLTQSPLTRAPFLELSRRTSATSSRTTSSLISVGQQQKKTVLTAGCSLVADPYAFPGDSEFLDPPEPENRSTLVYHDVPSLDSDSLPLSRGHSTKVKNCKELLLRSLAQQPEANRLDVHGRQMANPSTDCAFAGAMSSENSRQVDRGVYASPTCQEYPRQPSGAPRKRIAQASPSASVYSLSLVPTSTPASFSSGSMASIAETVRSSAPSSGRPPADTIAPSMSGLPSIAQMYAPHSSPTTSSSSHRSRGARFTLVSKSHGSVVANKVPSDGSSRSEPIAVLPSQQSTVATSSGVTLSTDRVFSMPRPRSRSSQVEMGSSAPNAAVSSFSVSSGNAQNQGMMMSFPTRPSVPQTWTHHRIPGLEAASSTSDTRSSVHPDSLHRPQRFSPSATAADSSIRPFQGSPSTLQGQVSAVVVPSTAVFPLSRSALVPHGEDSLALAPSSLSITLPGSQVLAGSPTKFCDVVTSGSVHVLERKVPTTSITSASPMLCMASTPSSCSFSSFSMSSTSARLTAAPVRSTSDVLPAGIPLGAVTIFEDASRLDDVAVGHPSAEAEGHFEREDVPFFPSSRSRNSSGDLNLEQLINVDLSQLHPDFLQLLAHPGTLMPLNNE